MLHKATMTIVELDDGETTAPIAELKRIIASDPFPMSPRIRTLRLILASCNRRQRDRSHSRHRRGPASPAMCCTGTDSVNWLWEAFEEKRALEGG